MNEEGINIIRAIAFSEQFLTSNIFTSGYNFVSLKFIFGIILNFNFIFSRFYVVSDPEGATVEYRNTLNIDQVIYSRLINNF